MTNYKLLLFYFLAFKLALVAIADLDYGVCSVSVNADNEVHHKLKGRWYEIKKSAESTGKANEETCNQIEFIFVRKVLGWKLVLKMRGLKKGQIVGKYLEAEPVVRLTRHVFHLGPAEEAKEKTPNFYIVHVDSEFALLYYCEESGPFKLGVAWILARHPKPSLYRLKAIEAKIQRLGLVDVNKLITVEQSNCER